MEKELNRAKSLLARRSTISEDTFAQAADTANDSSYQDAQHNDIPALHPVNNIPTDPVALPLSASNNPIQTTVVNARPGTTPGINDVSPSVGSGVTGAFSLETPPQRANFDWDERTKSRSEDRVPDGMAGLGGQHSRGYMGVASGAAFLRLADADTDDPAQAGDDQDGSEDSDTAVPTSLNSIAHLEPFVDAYFQTYHVSYPIVHESTFRAQFMEIIPRPRSQAWEVLAYIIATIGCFASSETTPIADQALFDAAKARLSVDMLETGNLMLVQALTLISNYVQKRNKPNSGYSYMGLAKRMAMGIGLHKEFPAWHTKPLMLEIRRRLWWGLYNFDVGAIITFSRPLDLPKEGIEVQLPLNVMDVDVTPSTTNPPTETQATTLYTHLRCQATFHLATSEIYSKMIAIPYPTAEEMVVLDDVVLTKFKNELPIFYREDAQQLPKYQFPHAVLHWRFHNFRILVFRAFVLRSLFSANSTDQSRERTPPSAAEDQAVQRCFETAEHTIKSISSFWQSNRHNVLTCWYGLYFLFQAVMIPVASLRNCPVSAQAPSWKEQIHLALNVMEQMAHLNPTAVRCQRALNNLCGRFLGPDSVGASSFNLESPQTQLQLMQSITWPMADTFDAIPLDMSWYDYGGQDNFNNLQDIA
ncbi:hypothetical protein K461DRAFT_95198 [Myriangium duriaei CBS 260.36]|uniref:Xylanolytic transcriptional activator regulatory domain-containing protein n=1 Tax=Myriangium duriaei CBS 260.36 TaxID=1168546 RepID=A0A9P4JB27_9PEZI|nr:hypothetical protein K461DRAFT_95198 [Myriangium duriaei CBS 260.36]